MQDNYLPTADIERLKQAGIIHLHETAVKVGDIIVAVDPQTGIRRSVDTSGVILESSRQLLRG